MPNIEPKNNFNNLTNEQFKKEMKNINEKFMQELKDNEKFFLSIMIDTSNKSEIHRRNKFREDIDINPKNTVYISCHGTLLENNFFKIPINKNIITLDRVGNILYLKPKDIERLVCKEKKTPDEILNITSKKPHIYVGKDNLIINEHVLEFNSKIEQKHYTYNTIYEYNGIFKPTDVKKINEEYYCFTDNKEESKFIGKDIFPGFKNYIFKKPILLSTLITLLIEKNPEITNFILCFCRNVYEPKINNNVNIAPIIPMRHLLGSLGSRDERINITSNEFRFNKNNHSNKKIINLEKQIKKNKNKK